MVNLSLLLKYADTKYNYAVFNVLQGSTTPPINTASDSFFCLEETESQAVRTCKTLNESSNSPDSVYTYWPLTRRMVEVNGMIETVVGINWYWV